MSADSNGQMLAPQLRDALLTAVLNAAVDGIVTIDSRGRIVAFNAAASKLFGYTAEEVVGKNVNTLMPEPYAEHHDDYLKRYLTSGERRIIGIGREVTGKRKDGSVFPMHLSVGEACVDGGRYFLGIIRDITAIKEAEAHRRRTSERLECQYRCMTLLAGASAPDEIIPGVLEEIGNHVGAEVADVWLEAMPGELQRRHTWSSHPGPDPFVSNDTRSGDMPWLTQPFFSGAASWLSALSGVSGLSPAGVEARGLLSACVHPMLAGRESRGVLVLMGKSADWQEDPELCQFVAAVSTELAIFLQRCDLQNELLEGERLAALGSMAAVFAHEVGNPLNNMALQAQMLHRRLSKSPTTNSFGEKLSSILGEIDRLGKLLDDFRSLSRKSGDTPLAPIALPELLARVLDDHVLCVPERAVEVRCDVPKSLPQIMGNWDKLTQVFLNVCKNALEAMPQGGVLEVRARSEPGQRVAITFSDTGPGLPKGIDVFEPFRTSKADGTGLGLVVVRQVITAHSGTVSASNNPDQGATFRITLPTCENGGIELARRRR